MVCTIVFVMVSSEANALLTWHARLLDDCGVEASVRFKDTFVRLAFFLRRPSCTFIEHPKKVEFYPSWCFHCPYSRTTPSGLLQVEPWRWCLSVYHHLVKHGRKKQYRVGEFAPIHQSAHISVRSKCERLERGGQDASSRIVGFDGGIGVGCHSHTLQWAACFYICHHASGL